jgi:hypothetical protein
LGFVTFLAMSFSVGVANAQTPAGQEQIKVLGHLPLESMHVNQMFVQQRGDQVYLFLHRPRKDAYAVVDVPSRKHRCW